jgi:hypothetical protein
MCTVRKEEASNSEVSVHRRMIQRRQELTPWEIELCAMLEEEPSNVCMPIS